MKTLLTYKSLFALLIALAFVISTGAVLAVAGEIEGAGKADTYNVEISESTGLPDVTKPAQEEEFMEHGAKEPIKILSSEEEGAGRAGSYTVESSESTGLPDVTLFK